MLYCFYLIYIEIFILFSLKFAQSSRLEDQRSCLPSPLPPIAPTVPDDDFFSLIMRFQAAGRLDDQRSALPSYNNNNRWEQQ